MAKFIDENGLLYLWTKIKNIFVAKEDGKGLSSNDFTTAEKEKLSGIESGAQVNVKPDWTSGPGTSSEILNKPTIPSKTSDLENDSGFITVDDVPEGSSASTTLPKMSGVAATGSETAFARGDHVHPSDTSKADKATTLSGYGITDAYTKTEIDSKVSSVYKPGGTVSFAELPEPSAETLGYVYNVSDAFTTDDRFIDPTPVEYPLGTNVSVISKNVEDTTKYFFDVLAGFIDLSGYMKKTDMVAITNEEIDSIVV